MGGGHKAAGGHRGVDLIAVRTGDMDKAEKEEDENPFYISHTQRTAGRIKGKSPRVLIRSPSKSDLFAPEIDTEDEGPSTSSPLAGHSLAPPNFGHSASSSRPSAAGPSTPTSHTLHLPPISASSPTPIRRSPRQAAKSAQILSMMDEANNPFLARSSDIHAPHPAPKGMDEHDRPYVTYVFRGSKKVFANPFTRPDMPFPPAELRPEDEDFEEHPCPKPRLLWPTANTKGEGEGEGMDIKVTPSPPSSPIMRTPTTRGGGKRTRFVTADRSLEAGSFNPPTEVYSDSEEERERVRAEPVKKVVSGVKGRKIKMVMSDDDEDEDQEEEVEPIVRRGLLFGPNKMAESSGSGVKRQGEEMVGRDGKKVKTLRL